MKPENRLLQLIRKYMMRGMVFRKSLITLLLVTSIPTLAIGISSFFIGVNQIKTEVKHTQNAQFQSVLSEIDKKLSLLEQIIGREAFSPAYPPELRNLDPVKHFDAINNLYQSFLVIKDQSSSIKEISVYFSQAGVCLSSEKGYLDISGSDQEKEFNALLDQKDPTIWSEASVNPDGAAFVSMVSLVRKVPGYSTEPYGIIIINVNLEEVTDSVNSISGSGEGISFIVDNNGQYVFADMKQEGAVENLNKALNENLEKNNSSAKSFFNIWNKVNYTVVYGTLPSTGWTLVVATPLDQLTKPVSNMARLIILTSILGFLTALFLALFGSIRAFGPFNKLFKYISSQTEEAMPDDELQYIENKWHQLVSEKVGLKESLEMSYPVLRNGFFIQLVQGHLNLLDELSLREQVKHYGLDVTGKSFVLLGIHISKSATCKEKFQEGDEQLITFAASNIIQDIMFEKASEAQVINLQNMMIGLLLFFKDDMPVNSVKSEINLLCEIMVKKLEIIGANTTICIGNISKSLEVVNKEFNDICKAINFRDINMDSQIIDMESESFKGKDLISIPLHIEEEIILALKMGAGHEALRLIRAFYDKIKQSSGKEYVVKQSMIQLLGHIQYELLGMGIDIYAIYDENMFEQILRINEPEEINKWFESKVVEPYIHYYQRSQNILMKRLVEGVVKIIEENYQTDISLEGCADKNNTYPQRLSAAFKAITGLTFVDYLNKYRINKAKTLLKYTNIDINKIAQSVGYQPSYFNRVFRKYEGITPGTYRSNHAECDDTELPGNV